MSKLHIYKASAGSGKTYTLVLHYLAYVLQPGNRFDQVLAITFTNKAAGEMKERIIKQLKKLTTMKPGDDYFRQLRDTMKAQNRTELDDATISLRATQVLGDMLHQYGRLAVGTIDSFFQRILRSHARELQISLNYNLHLNTDLLREELIDRLLEKLGQDEQDELTRWMLDMMYDQLNNNKSWNLRSTLLQNSKELLGNGFRQLFEQAKAGGLDLKEQATKMRVQLLQITQTFESRMYTMSEEAAKLRDEHNWSDNDFHYKNTGAYGFIRKVNQRAGGEDLYPMKRALDVAEGNMKLFSDEKNLSEAQQQLKDILCQMVELSLEQYPAYESAKNVLNHLHVLVILEELSALLEEIRKERNLLLISDTERLLEGVTRDNDAPFIYEKTGQYIRFYLLDEFQDTSNTQWTNLFPLLQNTLSEGNQVLVVGDVKQSIYRWRGGNMELLRETISRQLVSGQPELVPLNHNYRSASAIITANNSLFTSFSSLLQTKNSQLQGFTPFQSLFEDVRQELGRTKDEEPGYVRIEKVPFQKSDDDSEEGEPSGWREAHLARLPAILDELAADKYKPEDICFLVDTNKDGTQLARFLSEQNKTVMSQDSLLIGQSLPVQLIIETMQCVTHPANPVHKATMAVLYKQFHNHEQVDIDGTLVTDSKQAASWAQLGLPEKLHEKIGYWAQMPLARMVEDMLQVMGVTAISDAFVFYFLDLVLDFAGTGNQDPTAFLEWWEEEGCDKPLPADKRADAMPIMTIHKSKGLQFPVVILPFLELTFQHRFPPLMWIASPDIEPYNLLPYVPVRYKNKKDEKKQYNHLFQEAFTEERNLMICDQLNKWYVAFTRPEDRLYALAAGYNGQSDSVAKSLPYILGSESLMGNGEPFNKYWNADFLHWTFGNRVARKAKEEQHKETTPSHPVTTMQMGQWQQKLVIKQMAYGKLSRESDALMRGRLLHEALERLQHKDDINRVVQSLQLEGWLSHEEQPAMIATLQQLLSHAQIGGWFDPEWTAIAEKSLLLPDGTMLRPDRVLLKGREALIIDYKTGKQRPEYAEQVKAYADAITDMGYQVTGSYLLYTDDITIETV